jgi:hypothetical protein
LSGKSFDGRANFPVDDQIEEALDQHFQNFGVTPREIWRNFPIYTRRVFLKRFLAHYQLFQKTIDLPGDIVEIGVYRGATLLSWANFLEIHNMGDRQKRVFGFDNFAGFTPLDEKDGKESERVQKAVGGFSPESFEESLRDAIKIFDEDRFIPYKPRIVLVKGNAEETIPQFVKDYPGVRISLLHMDVDIYKPSLTALQHLWPLVVPGGVVAFDEYGIPPWEGESKAVDEFFAGKNIRMERFTWSSNPGAFVIKP